MSNFHSTVSRRDFMKGLGLAGVGLGAASAAAPVFHDLDEVGTSAKANYKQPWYVKELEFEKPSVEVDWSIMQSWDSGRDANPISFSRGYASNDPVILEGHHYRQVTRQEEIAAIKEAGLQAGTPGYALRDNALSSGAGGFGPSRSSRPCAGPNVTSPEKRGVPKWTGTQEEATKMVRAAAHFYGSAKIGVLELTPNIKKLASPSRIRFETTDEPYEDGRVDVIPNRARWSIAYLVGQSTEMTKRGITRQQAGSSLGYSYGPIIQVRLQKFLKSLGYLALASSVPGQNVAAGALSGTGELCRGSFQITHEWGPMIRYTPTIVTD